MMEDLGGLGIRLFVVLDGHGEVSVCCCCCLRSVVVFGSGVENRCRGWYGRSGSDGDGGTGVAAP